MFRVYTGTPDAIQREREVGISETFLGSVVPQLGKHTYQSSFRRLFGSARACWAGHVGILGGRRVARDWQADQRRARDSDRLEVPSKFGKQVCRYVAQHTKQCPGDSFFLVYHSDTDWHPEFFYRVEKKPLPTNFLGLSSNLDTLCIWMKFIRSLMLQAKGKRKPEFHILVPAYRPLLIKDPIIFPQELFPLTIEGHIHESVPLVWLNLPEVPPDDLKLTDIGNLTAPPSTLQNWRKPIAYGTFLTTCAAGIGANILLRTATAATMPVLTPVVLLGGIAATGAGAVAAEKVVKGNLEILKPRILGGSLGSDEIVVERETRRVRGRSRR